MGDFDPCESVKNAGQFLRVGLLIRADSAKNRGTRLGAPVFIGIAYFTSFASSLRRMVSPVTSTAFFTTMSSPPFHLIIRVTPR